jgi:hypothetical protein
MTLKVETPKKIPRHLIYEMDEGRPIYYRWYKEYLNGNENYEETMPDSSLQSWLKNQISFLITFFLQGNKNYVVTVGEQGLSLKKKSWRGADIAIFKRENFQLTPEFAKLPPEVVIEINIKGYYETQEKALADYERKNAQLLEFGVQKIIWIFTEPRQITVLTKSGRENFNWNESISVMDGIEFNAQALIDQFEEEA